MCLHRKPKQQVKGILGAMVGWQQVWGRKVSQLSFCPSDGSKEVTSVSVSQVELLECNGHTVQVALKGVSSE